MGVWGPKFYQSDGSRNEVGPQQIRALQPRTKRNGMPGWAATPASAIRKYDDYRVDANTEVHGCSEYKIYFQDLLGLWFVYSWKPCADMGSERFVSRCLVSPFHFLN
jgi:hypothetical protein